MILGIILAIAGIICCLIVFIIDVIHSDAPSAIGMILLVFINIFILKYNLDEYNKPKEVQTTVVKDIQGFSVDSTLTISGADTTKTYTLTYWK